MHIFGDLLSRLLVSVAKLVARHLGIKKLIVKEITSYLFLFGKRATEIDEHILSQLIWQHTKTILGSRTEFGVSTL